MERTPRATANAPAATNWKPPESIYIGEAGRLLTPFRDRVNGLIESISSFTRGRGVSLAKAKIWRSISREDPTYYEYVVTFFSDDEPTKLIGCTDELSEFVGKWRRGQPSAVRDDFADKVSVELLPLGLE